MVVEGLQPSAQLRLLQQLVGLVCVGKTAAGEHLWLQSWVEQGEQLKTKKVTEKLWVSLRQSESEGSSLFARQRSAIRSIA
ncbi:hypothetical protein I0D68_03885 [Pseudomonas lalucatii]|nr:hypothetical protein [Pseudomonas lalucatii]QVM88060.1 hypothetical protein I0D68_03885 [Pseudomonas lalucatii]